jgi:transcriptional regulator with XRE-family HTH domain
MTTQTLGQYLRFLREEKRLTLEKLSMELEEKGLNAGKPQLSHIENSRRTPNGELLEKLIEILEPTAEQLTDLRSICQRGGIGIDLPVLLRSIQSVDVELETQQKYDEIYVIAELPIELIDISDKNQLATDLATELQEANRIIKYVYWTVESSLEKFQNLFRFLERRGVTTDVIDRTFKIVIAPKQMSTLTYAIYSSYTEDRATSRVGRIVIRNLLSSPSLFQITAMGQADVEATYQQLRDIYNALELSHDNKYQDMYELISVGNIELYLEAKNHGSK